MDPAQHGQGRPHPVHELWFVPPAPAFEHVLSNNLAGAITCIGNTSAEAEICPF